MKKVVVKKVTKVTWQAVQHLLVKFVYIDVQGHQECSFDGEEGIIEDFRGK